MLNTLQSINYHLCFKCKDKSNVLSDSLFDSVFVLFYLFLKEAEEKNDRGIILQYCFIYGAPLVLPMVLPCGAGAKIQSLTHCRLCYLLISELSLDPL